MAAGEKNVYYCGICRGYVVTLDVDDGVTPAFLACRVLGEPTDPANTCYGRMVSMWYPQEPWPEKDGNDTPIPTEVTWEWYKPENLDGLEPALREHIEMGGLALRQVKDAPSL